jgi:dolichol kinase
VAGKRATDRDLRRIIGWGGVVLAAIGVIGAIYLPSLRLLWIVLLVFAIGSVPQALMRGDPDKKERAGHRR